MANLAIVANLFVVAFAPEVALWLPRARGLVT